MHENLRKLRESKGITQEQISKQLGYKTRNAYSLKERGKRKITLEEAQKISIILNESIDNIFLTI